MKRSKFSLSHTNLFTADMGYIIPINVMDVLPGDTVQQATSALVRVSPLLAPVMHPVQVKIHHWFVPNRIIWEDWENFITGGDAGLPEWTFPTLDPGVVAVGSLHDYLGVPIGAQPDVSALPYRAYNLIYNEFYRDQDLTNPLPISVSSGTDTTTNVFLARAAWEKDYFTSSRPFEQKGPTVYVPIGSTAPVVQDPATTVGPIFHRFGAPADLHGLQMTNGSANVTWTSGTPTGTADAVWADPNLVANLAAAAGVSINDLREALAIQRFQEARARYGSRYVEYLRYLGVRSSDARLQRPEYLGGGKQTIQFSEVLQTGPDNEDGEGVATLRGHGIGAVRSNRYRRFFEEHGYVISVMIVRPKAIYGNGLFRHWNRRFKEDFWQRELQHIGQQAVANKEVYGLHSSPDGVFGYQDRYDEYRRAESRVSGEFRDQLDFWHYARLFESDVALNDSFVQADVTKRVNAVQNKHVLWVMCNHSIQARRMVAAQGTSYIY